jgi:hypothetical protein
MCIGRVGTADHPWHAYLAALPASSPEPTCWPIHLREELRATPVGVSLTAARDFVQRVYDGFVARLVRERNDLIPAGIDSVDSLLWARGMCRSRSFPISLEGPVGSGEGAVPVFGPEGTEESSSGVLLPFFDLLNHRHGQPIEWNSNSTHVEFATPCAVKSGDEVYNNYGGRPNEELIFSYGFCIHPNAMDAVSLVLACKTDTGACSSKRFYVRKEANGGVPAELFKAMAALTYEQDEGEEDTEDSVGLEEIEALVAAFSQKLSALEASRDKDNLVLAAPPPPSDLDLRELHIAVYRNGQREILSEVVETYRTLLQQSANDDEDASTDELDT